MFFYVKGDIVNIRSWLRLYILWYT